MSLDRGRTGLGHGRTTRLGAVVLASTLVLTTAFVGVLAVVSGGNDGLGGRLPAYVLVMAVAFVGFVVLAEQRLGTGGGVDGRRVIVTAGGVALTVLVTVALSGEGVVYAVRNPEGVVASEVFLYFLAAGLIGTGLGYWGLRHWREFAAGTLVPSGRL
jgi:hypothetical protein